MQILSSSDQNSFKYIHDDNSETIIKVKSSCSGSEDTTTIFLPSSIGCAMRCKFCSLAADKNSFTYLSPARILRNGMDALDHFFEEYDYFNRRLKISWMGMGEPSFLGENLNIISKLLAEYSFSEGYSYSLKRIDVSTSIPSRELIEPLTSNLTKLKRDLRDGTDFSLETASPPVRLFLSIISAIPDTRRELMGTSVDLNSVFYSINKAVWEPKSIIIHHLLLDKINDSEQEMNAFINYINEFFPESEIRILRYNPNSSEYRESRQYHDCVRYIKENLPNIREQEVIGKDIKASCGQFHSL